jgi:pyrroloquinoline-quinone synthase
VLSVKKEIFLLLGQITCRNGIQPVAPDPIVFGQNARMHRENHGMLIEEFLNRLDQAINHYDLLRHPFYQAWSLGELTRQDIAEYGGDYYHHVEAFPRALAQFSRRLSNTELRAVVLANLTEEMGSRPCDSHASLWLDFAEGFGVVRPIRTKPSPAITKLMTFFEKIAREGTPEEVLASFYAYESQVPRISKEKVRGLRDFYGADDRTCHYFLVHITADLAHAQSWRAQLTKRIELYPKLASIPLASATRAASALWKALDGIENARMTRNTAPPQGSTQLSKL